VTALKKGDRVKIPLRRQGNETQFKWYGGDWNGYREAEEFWNNIGMVIHGSMCVTEEQIKKGATVIDVPGITFNNEEYVLLKIYTKTDYVQLPYKKSYVTKIERKSLKNLVEESK